MTLQFYHATVQNAYRFATFAGMARKRDYPAWIGGSERCEMTLLPLVWSSPSLPMAPPALLLHADHYHGGPSLMAGQQ